RPSSPPPPARPLRCSHRRAPAGRPGRSRGARGGASAPDPSAGSPRAPGGSSFFSIGTLKHLTPAAETFTRSLGNVAAAAGGNGCLGALPRRVGDGNKRRAIGRVSRD